MTQNTKEVIDTLLSSIASLEKVQSIGISGCINPIPKAGEGDIDVFIYCDEIPKPEERQEIVSQFGQALQNCKFNVFEEGHWGIGDFVSINGIETWLMYFTARDTLNNVEAILNGEYPDKLDNYYYPVGRCAMLKNINIIIEKENFLYSLKERLSQYPDRLANILIQYHLERLEDTEDLERAVVRKDVLFYHFAMEIAIDHFLQALFAMNNTYFPSRKRSIDYIQGFGVKPDRCCERLLDIIRLGGYAEGISKSYELWVKLVNELISVNR